MSEESLMLAVKEGDLKQASGLFDLYNQQLYNFFAKITYDRDLAQDLTQNVFLRLIKFRHTYKEVMRFKPWIYQIARNVFADHYRKSKTLKNENVDIEMVGESIEDIDESLARNEQERILYLSMDRLKMEDREILLMSKFQKMKYEEISQVLETSVSAVKVKVHRAIKRLQTHYFELEKI
ncbi:MAG: sigma-70 family RNA polymerase sigma factor [Cyclobacteriaceae bacterium]